MNKVVWVLLASLFSSQFALAESVGGIDGGGGGSLPEEQLRIDEVHRYIDESKRDLRLYIKYQMAFEKESDRLFGKAPNAWTTLESVNLDIRDDRACTDSHGAEKDASVASSLPNVICISALRLSRALGPERARIEISALLLHEISHLLGADEAEAQSVQRDMRYFLRQGTHDQAAEEFQKTNLAQVEVIQRAFSKFTVEGTDEQLAESLSTLQSLISVFQDLSLKMPYSVFDKAERAHEWVQTDQVMLAHWWAMGRLNDRPSEYWRGEYAKAFGGKKLARYEDVIRSTRGALDNDFPQSAREVQLRRIDSREDLKANMTAVAKYFDHVAEYLYALYFKNAVAPLPVPNYENPWRFFVGGYNVTARDCSAGATRTDLVRIEIRADGDGYTLREFVPNGFGDHSLDPQGVDMGRVSVAVAGNAQSALQRTEGGDLWSAWFVRESLKIERTSDGYQLVRESMQQNRRSGAPTTSSDSCKFLLRKS